jgi:hypothetical protein
MPGAGKIEYPKDHEPGMKVPKGGSSCASCKYLRPELECSNEYFQKWHGSNKIPTKDASSYCSDWYEEGERKKRSLSDHLRDQKREK